MKLENPIGWCDATTNVVTGCDKVSPGCKNCYAESGTRARVLRSQGRETWGAKGERVPVNFEPVFRRLNKLCVCDRCHSANLAEYLGMGCTEESYPNNNCGGTLRRIRLFADSNSDWLDPKWSVETLAKFLDAIRLTPNVDVLLLTKRIENAGRIAEVMSWMQDTKQDTGHDDHPEDNLFQWCYYWIIKKMPPKNVWLGVSVEDQKRADERIPLLLNTPAAVRFLSVEPLLEDIDFKRQHDPLFDPEGIGIDWVIVGGESGKNRRDCGVMAITSVVRQCVDAGVAVYCKQDVSLLPGQQGRLGDDVWKRKEFPR